MTLKCKKRRSKNTVVKAMDAIQGFIKFFKCVSCVILQSITCAPTDNYNCSMWVKNKNKYSIFYFSTISVYCLGKCAAFIVPIKTRHPTLKQFLVLTVGKKQTDNTVNSKYKKLRNSEDLSEQRK